MNDHASDPGFKPADDGYVWDFEAAAAKSLALRRASGEILTYRLDGWMVQEHPGGRIERLAPFDEFRAEDFPYPGFVEPKR